MNASWDKIYRKKWADLIMSLCLQYKMDKITYDLFLDTIKLSIEKMSLLKDVPEIEIEFERVEIKAGTRKLSENWTCELDQEVVCMYGFLETRWQRFTHWVNYLFRKDKIKKL